MVRSWFHFWPSGPRIVNAVARHYLYLRASVTNVVSCVPVLPGGRGGAGEEGGHQLVQAERGGGRLEGHLPEQGEDATLYPLSNCDRLSNSFQEHLSGKVE